MHARLPNSLGTINSIVNEHWKSVASHRSIELHVHRVDERSEKLEAEKAACPASEMNKVMRIIQGKTLGELNLSTSATRQRWGCQAGQ